MRTETAARASGRSGVPAWIALFGRRLGRMASAPERTWWIVQAAWLSVAAGCGSPQSALDPGSPGAEEIAALWWVMFWTVAVLSTVVIGLCLHSLYRARSAAGREDGSGPSSAERRAILLAGTLLPGGVLITFLVLSVRTGASVFEPPSQPELTVQVTGHQFWWEVHYPALGIITANEIHIPAGVPVEVEVTSADVIHSFWVPALSPGKTDMIHGRRHSTWMMAEEPGIHRGQCTEFCGVQHALMALQVIALPPEEFELWVDERSRPRPEPQGVAARGRMLFLREGCASCHAVRDVSAPIFAGNPGPDLTHLAERRTIGALTLPNTRDNLAAWVRNPHDLKPGVRMPPSPLEDDELDALIDFLVSLR